MCFKLQLLALHLEMLGCIIGLLKGFEYLRKTGDLIGDNLTLRLLRRTLVLDAPCNFTALKGTHFYILFDVYSKQFKLFERHLDLYQSLYDFFAET